jgi:pre-rRNA-processing protein TSR3
VTVVVRPPIRILRDPRESPRKCSLVPLAGTPGIEFHAYRHDRRVDAAGFVLLSPDGTPFEPSDRARGLFLIDCSWKKVAKLARVLDGACLPRRLPELATAYPRKSRVFADPSGGVASVEALYATVYVLHGDDRALLRHYRWAERFLTENLAALERERARLA